MDQNKKIEQLIKDKLERGSHKPMSQPQWHLIASKINYKPQSPIRKKRIWISWSIAASLAIFILSGWLFWNMNSSSEINWQATPQQKVAFPSNTEQENNLEDDSISMPVKQGSAISPSSSIDPLLHQNKNIAHHLNIITEETITDSPNIYLIKSSQEEEQEQVSTTSDREANYLKELITQSPNSYHNYYNLIEEEHPLKYIPKIEAKPFSLGVTGAVNYGNQNSGYVVALSARQDLGKHFFVDGSVSMVYNNTSDEVVGLPTSMKKADLLSPIPVQNAIQREVINHIPAVNTLYLQINPKIGYKIIEEVAISMGPDFQKLMNENHYSGFNYYALSDHGVLSQLPSIDVGFTAQTEVDLSKNLKAGLLYRQGMNNLLNTHPNLYINRNYLQFQLKYSIGFKNR